MKRGYVRSAWKTAVVALLAVAGLLAQSGGGPVVKPVSFSGELRLRLEYPTGLSYREGSNDFYGLTRARLQINLKPAAAWSGRIELQDSRAPGLSSPRPATAESGFDVRQAWVRYAPDGENGWSVQAGRLPLRLGSGRLAWDPDWSNTGTVFDGTTLTMQAGRARVDGFAAAPVAPRAPWFDRTQRGVLFYGVFGSMKLDAGLKLESYLMLRRYSAPLQSSPETHSVWGGRAFGSLELPGKTASNYELEVAGQSGRLRGRVLQAWGMVGSFTISPFHTQAAPVLTLTYTHATGDRTPGDATRSTFQVFYPSVHLRTGATDRLGWSNLRDWLMEARWSLPRKTGLSAGVHLPRLDTAADALYSKTGAPILLCPGATSTRIGTEVFVLLDREFTRDWSAGAGLAHLFPGAFLAQAGHQKGISQPFVYLTYRF